MHSFWSTKDKIKITDKSTMSIISIKVVNKNNLKSVFPFTIIKTNEFDTVRNVFELIAGVGDSF